MSSEELTLAFAALSDKNRLAIYRRLQLEVATPVLLARLLLINDKIVSRCLVQLEEAKLVVGVHQGRNTFYATNRDTAATICECLSPRLPLETKESL